MKRRHLIDELGRWGHAFVIVVAKRRVCMTTVLHSRYWIAVDQENLGGTPSGFRSITAHQPSTIADQTRKPLAELTTIDAREQRLGARGGTTGSQTLLNDTIACRSRKARTQESMREGTSRRCPQARGATGSGGFHPPYQKPTPKAPNRCASKRPRERKLLPARFVPPGSVSAFPQKTEIRDTSCGIPDSPRGILPSSRGVQARRRVILD